MATRPRRLSPTARGLGRSSATGAADGTGVSLERSDQGEEVKSSGTYVPV
jgi:hypothetical protein